MDEQHNGPLVISAAQSPEQVLTGLVHEFRHPINAIKGYANLVLKEGFDSQQAAEHILKVATNMEIVQDAVFDYLRARRTLEE